MLTLRQMRRDALGIAMLVVVPVVTVFWLWSSAGAAMPPTLPTGASFSLAARAGGGERVVAGPFVTVEEVERAQRRLRRGGTAARLLVDESIRLSPRAANVSTARPDAEPRMVLIGAGRQITLAMEMDAAPAVVEAMTTRGSLIEIQVGPFTDPLVPQVWNGPPSAPLINQVSVERVERDGQSFARTRIALANVVEARTRVVDTRVYVDLLALAEPEAEDPRPAPRRNVPASTPAVAPASPAEAPMRLTGTEYRELIAPAEARLKAIENFAAAALASPSAEVLDALAATLDDLHAWLETIDPPVEAEADHQVLMRSTASLLEIVRAATPRPQPSTALQP